MTVYHAGLYMRLSKDDGAGESASISTQRKMLRSYAKEHGFEIYREYVDDGFSGTSFQRPAWEALISDIEARRVNLVITKDLSRLGRDYIITGQFTEIYFPAKKVRYIAINDGYDSDRPLNDIAPFKNIVNEMYARDTSKKIRSAFQTKIREGSFIGNFAPYGYEKDPFNKNHLVIDPVTAPVVREIFERAEKGESPSCIADALNEREVLTPSMYRCVRHPYLQPPDTSGRKMWTSGTICKMLGNAVYLGHVVQGKTSKLSFKSNITLSHPKEEWVVVKHMHEPLVSQEVFDRINKRSVSRKGFRKTDFINVFSGIAVCGDCGRNMSVTGKNGKSQSCRLVCGGYKQYGTQKCTSHSMDYALLYQTVLKEIKALLNLTVQEQEEIQKACSLPACLKNGKEAERSAAPLRKRSREISRIIGQLYEDKVNKRISEELFYEMLASLEKEQKEIAAGLLSEKIKNTEKEDQEQAGACQWAALFKEITDEEKLTRDLIYKFIEKIEICQSTEEVHEGKRRRCQKIRIYFKTRGLP
ncbi:recombinase family protein [Lacrimispora sp.]|uniref:recombinase family protein n=1 Tax=Lacrimispora sp. TaxID=2719234 RepID=UPI0039946F9E